MKAAAAATRRWLLWRSGLPGRLNFDALLLMYHRFCADGDDTGLPRRHFAEQLDYLQRHFAVVPLDQALAPRERDARPRVVITVDDGYRTFHEHAWPELRRRDLAASVYLPTQFIDEGGWMWQDRNIYLLRRAAPRRHRLTWCGEVVELDLDGTPRLMSSLSRIYEIGRRLDPAGRLELTATLSRAVDLPLPAGPPPEYAPLDWTQVREMAAGGVTFGSHTVNHAILTTCDPDTARAEIVQSRAILAERIGRPVTSFAYPNGDFDPRVRAMVVDAGYDNALATFAGYWSAGGDRFAVPRLPAPGGGAAILADRIWCWWREFGAPAPQLASTSP